MHHFIFSSNDNLRFLSEKVFFNDSQLVMDTPGKHVAFHLCHSHIIFYAYLAPVMWKMNNVMS